MWIFLVLVGMSVLWLGGWSTYIIYKTKGKITPKDLLIATIICAATATEIWRLPEYSPEWRKKPKR